MGGRPALVGGGDDDGGDDASGDGGQDVVAIDFAPLVAAGRLAEMVGVPVDLGATVPVIVVDVAALFPFVMVDVVAVVVLITLIVMVILGESERAGKGEGEGGNRQNSEYCLHG